MGLSLKKTKHILLEGENPNLTHDGHFMAEVPII